ncbi:Lysine-rich arabinogalactan protein 18 [Glycine soja]|uniref:Lysine-rich arabinogalactan protein 18 n=1 Tax=Glycine soja TaxID=3848 RepID=A0A0B2SBB8_GLYSO|nr:Lysine-rich arabinogalactan protein 18 [Glycine soja]
MDRNGPPAPPTGAPGPSEDASSPGPGTAANDESGAETIMCLKKVLGGLGLGWATLVLVF